MFTKQWIIDSRLELFHHFQNSINALVMNNSLQLKIAIEIVDLPIDSMVMFHGYLDLLEGTLGSIKAID